MADRIMTTHVGSLIRPPQFVEILTKLEKKEPIEPGLYEKTLTQSVAEVVRQQAEANVDIVSDGEFGKGRNWAFYVHGRLSGMHTRPMTPEELKDPMASVGGGRDREAFPEYYAEADKGRPGSRSAARQPLRLQRAHSPTSGQRRWSSATSPTCKPRLPKSRSRPCVPPAGRAGQRAALLREGRALRATRRSLLVRARRRAARSNTSAYRRCRPAAFRSTTRSLPYTHEAHRARRRRSRNTGKWRRAAHRRAQPRARGSCRRRKSRYHVCWGSWSGPHMSMTCRSRTSSTSCCSGCTSAHTSLEAANVRHEHEWKVWQSRESCPPARTLPARRDQPRHQRGRASRTGSGAVGAVRQCGWPRERHGIYALPRISVCAPCISIM